MTTTERRTIPNEEFYCRFIAPEERKDRWTSPWDGGFRWYELKTTSWRLNGTDPQKIGDEFANVFGQSGGYEMLRLI